MGMVTLMVTLFPPLSSPFWDCHFLRGHLTHSIIALWCPSLPLHLFVLGRTRRTVSHTPAHVEEREKRRPVLVLYTDLRLRQSLSSAQSHYVSHQRIDRIS
jgi:hypothetical protein